MFNETSTRSDHCKRLILQRPPQPILARRSNFSSLFTVRSFLPSRQTQGAIIVVPAEEKQKKGKQKKEKGNLKKKSSLLFSRLRTLYSVTSKDRQARLECSPLENTCRMLGNHMFVSISRISHTSKGCNSLSCSLDALHGLE